MITDIGPDLNQVDRYLKQRCDEILGRLQIRRSDEAHAAWASRPHSLEHTVAPAALARWS